MAMANDKVNPRKKPATQADVDRARFEGRVQGSELMLTCIIWLLCDKHDAPKEELLQFSDEIRYLLESIAEGRVGFPLIRKTLKEEYDWEVHFYVGDNLNTRGKSNKGC